MSLRNLFSLGTSFASIGIFLFSLLLVLFLVIYFLIYKKLLHGQRELSLTRIFWWGCFFCYCVVVLFATIFFRISAEEASPIHPPFYSYRDAWAHWSVASWRIIILNFCMFVPLGFLLPLGKPFFRKMPRILLAGFGSSLLIELIQLITHAGMFEWDDLLGNTVGTLIGYGCYLILAWLGRLFHKERPLMTGKTLLAQLPLLITCCVFCGIFLCYQGLELGIHPATYVTRYPTKLITTHTAFPLSAEKEDAMVYQFQTLTPTQARETGKMLFTALGSDMSSKDNMAYDNMLALSSTDERYSIWIDFIGGSYLLTDYRTLFPKDTEIGNPVTGATKAEVMQALEVLGLPDVQNLSSVKEDALQFQELSNGRYQFTAERAIHLGNGLGSNAKDGETLRMGTLICLYYSGGIAQVENKLCVCKEVKKYPLLSQQEAYDKLQKGEFDYFGREQLDIKVQDCHLIYVSDSKGFYQPTYDFFVIINDMEDHVYIPAI